MKDWVQDFIDKFNMHIDPNDPDARQLFVDHVKIFMAEEFQELNHALEVGDVEEIIDALGDISWHCDKGMKMVGVDPQRVRDEIGRANLSKVAGVKPGRENALRDVIKPEGWVAPNHGGNHGHLPEILA